MPKTRVITAACWIYLGACVALGCDAAPGELASDAAVAPIAPSEPPPHAPAREHTRPGFCERPRADTVRDVFCGDTRPAVTDLHTLQELLDLNPAPKLQADGVTPVDFNPLAISGPTVTVLAHSTALSGHLVSPINPRVIILGSAALMTFQRGVQRVELIAQDRERDALNFYLLSFQQACNAQPDGCTPGDLYTPRIESNWAAVAVRDDEDLKNTPSDCRQCHQRGRELPTLLMRELEIPWTHFFEPVVDESQVTPLPGVRGRHLMMDYEQAKGDEPYGGYVLQMLPENSPLILQNAVAPVQPVLFDAPKILQERYPYGPNGFATEPVRSPTWDGAYAAFKRGEQLALPYFEQRVSDPQKQARLSEAYARYRAGEIEADALPDLGDIFPDDPHVRAEIGLQNEPDATPAEALIQVCASCHNDVLDQSISRARFSVDLARLDRATLDAAVDRLERPRSAPGAMPPPEARQLDPDTRDRLLEYLRADPSVSEVDPMLQRAAALGMSGGARTRP
jgi:mono/diheme cytochrome c family protein